MICARQDLTQKEINMNNVFIKNHRGGFTLIELLVVVAIIGVLASVVLASLNSARAKGTAAAIKSNLKNAISEAEMAYDTAGNYSTACTVIAKMLTAVTNAGGTTSTSCLSFNNPSRSDVYLRWGASAIKGTSTPIQAWSSSGMGAVTWDVQGVNTSGTPVSSDVTMTWDQANTACGLAGGRLPTLEELYSLSAASYAASGNTSYRPGFVANHYWSSITVPSDNTTAYTHSPTGGIYNMPKNTSGSVYVRCVR